ncbi:MAG: hypothetical protein JG782_1144, partial [Anaerophaga sp.]|nr:hypothetical protein [Anaerophaga sp.]
TELEAFDVAGKLYALINKNEPI